MSLAISHRLHQTTGTLDRDPTLPELPGATRYGPGMFDQMGEQLQRSWPLVAAGGIGGGVIGSKLLRLGGGGIFRGIIGGIAGVLGGTAISMAGLAMARGTGAHHASPAPSGATAASTTVAARERVKVMTWNLHGGMGGPGRYYSSAEELDRLAEAIRAEHPDVLLLQEVDDFSSRSNLTDTLGQLDRRLHPTSAVEGTGVTTILGRDQDVAVMTFNGFRISDARNVVHADPRGGGVGVRAKAQLHSISGVIDRTFGTHLASPDDAYQVRNTIDTMVRTPGGTDLRVLSGHYEWPHSTYDPQGQQVGAMARALDAWHGPTIWGADFNVHSGTPNGARERTLMAGAGLHDSFERAPADVRIPMARRVSDPSASPRPEGGIDRIYASDHATVVETHVDHDAGMASDHLPVVTELELQPGAAPATH